MKKPKNWSQKGTLELVFPTGSKWNIATLQVALEQEKIYSKCTSVELYINPYCIKKGRC